MTTTLTVLTRYIKIDEKGNVNALGLLSKDTYKEWLSSRKYVPKDPPHAFRKVITGHCRGDRGLAPFNKDVEASLLILLRRKKVWECFEGTTTKIGLRGFQTLGFWESKEKGSPNNEKRKLSQNNRNRGVKRTKCNSKANVALAMNSYQRSITSSSLQVHQDRELPNPVTAFQLEQINPQLFVNYQRPQHFQQFGNLNLTPPSVLVQQQLQRQIDSLKLSLLQNLMIASGSTSGPL